MEEWLHLNTATTLSWDTSPGLCLCRWVLLMYSLEEQSKPVPMFEADHCVLVSPISPGTITWFLVWQKKMRKKRKNEEGNRIIALINKAFLDQVRWTTSAKAWPLRHPWSLARLWAMTTVLHIGGGLVRCKRFEFPLKKRYLN